jgi:hypothetical protein
MPRWLHGIHEQRMFMECSTCLWIHLKLERFHLYRSIKRHRFYEWLWSSYLSRRVRTRYSKSKTFDWTVQYTKNKNPRRSSLNFGRILSEGSFLKDPLWKILLSLTNIPTLHSCVSRCATLWCMFCTRQRLTSWMPTKRKEMGCILRL